MSFLAPWFLVGGLAVLFPIWFHLMRRTTRDVKPFSSLLFLQPTPPRMSDKSRLEHWFLLLLRVLALALLALAFARPFFSDSQRQAKTPGNGSKWVFLVDRSLSMRRPGIWEQVPSEVSARLDKVGAEDSVSVLVFDGSTQTLVSFDEWSQTPLSARRALVMGRLEGMEPQWGGTRIGEALIRGLEIFEEDESSESNGDREWRDRQLVLVSDGAAGSDWDELEGYEWPENVAIWFEPLEAKEPGNAWMRWVEELHPWAGSGASGERLKVRVHNSSDASRFQFRVGWDEGDRAKDVSVYVPAGQSREVEVALPEGSVSSGVLTLEGDGFQEDNHLYWVRPSVSEISIGFWGDVDEKDLQAPLYYLKRALLNSSKRTIRWDLVRSGPLVADRYSLVVVYPRQGFTDGKFLRPLLDSGSMVLLITPGGVNLAGLNDLATGGGFLSWKEAEIKDYALLGKIDFQHPLFATFADPRFSDFSKIHFWKHRKLYDWDRAFPEGRGLAWFDSMDPAILEVPWKGGGLLLISSFSWHPEESQFALSSKFVPFLYSLLSLKGDLDEVPNHLEVGETWMASSASDGQDLLQLTDPGGKVVPGRDGRWGPLEIPGIYTVESQGENPGSQVAVNVADREGETGLLSMEHFERFGLSMNVPLEVQTRKAEEERERSRAELEASQRYWWRALWVVMGLLVLETGLAGWGEIRSRRLVGSFERAAGG